MPVMTSYPHGVPSWIDIATPDPAGSKTFYGAIFDWEFDDQPTDQPGIDYTMARRGEHGVAGMMQLTEEMAASGMPPVWTSYVAVDDLDATVDKVGPAGGTVLQPPMQVMDAGRMSVLADPSGAVFALWEPMAHLGAGIVNEPGTLGWNELITPDPAATATFYRAVLGWSTEIFPMPEGEYTVFHADGGNDGGIAGAMEPPMPGMPPFWGVYFIVDDVAATVDLASELGATVLMPTTEMAGVGILAALLDPQGAGFSVMSPETPPT